MIASKCSQNSVKIFSEGGLCSFSCYIYVDVNLFEGLICLWLLKKITSHGIENMYFLYKFSPELNTHLWLRCSSFFNPFKKNSFGCAANHPLQLIWPPQCSITFILLGVS
jgi:hypothetical protein